MARSEVNIIYDAENAFRAPGSAALTATGVVGAKALDKLANVRPSSQRNKLGAEGYKIAIVVEALDTADADETYVLSAEVGAAGAAATKVGEIAVTETGQWVLELDAQSIEKADADHAEIELNLTVGGTTPSIQFAAWIV